ncbi:serine/threonine protein kinase [Trichophyton tonsurans CBS 112818]|uniref:Serine/threonine protein kinase n=1 Tax=Trichophyton tonsurans (strain CBS 112818) TaxID=647933 RepID=F2RSP4_TRIT1|nr:serine/threonine protein kinase [Trichophyton tonsurans CBS 112818]
MALQGEICIYSSKPGWYSAYRDVTVYVHTCRTRKSGLGDPGYASYFTVLHYLSRRSWKCTRGEGYDEVVVDEIDVYSYPSLSESEIEDLEDPAGLFRSIWPERRGKNCDDSIISPLINFDKAASSILHIINLYAASFTNASQFRLLDHLIHYMDQWSGICTSSTCGSSIHKPYEVPTHRLDGKPSAPHAPLHVVYPMKQNMPSNEMTDPEILISDYGTSFAVSKTTSPRLHTPTLYAPPEDFFNDRIIGTAADVWTLGVVLYDAMGERPLFETFAWDPDDIIAEMVNTLGYEQMPERWWNSWKCRSEFFNEDGSWVSNFRRIGTPVFRRLHQRMWDMGRGETPESCQWDVAGGELKALEDMLRSMMTFEPAQRPTARQLMASEYMVKWALPAWQKQMRRKQ